MFVFGLPRTGTTMTINLLNADSQRRCFLRWEALNPVPPAATGALHSDPRCHAEQLRDPIGVMQKLYAHFNEPFTSETEARMKRQLARNPQGKHGKHVYSLQEFGLSAPAVRAHFRSYCERFDI